jgi:hypothetical protein
LEQPWGKENENTNAESVGEPDVNSPTLSAFEHWWLFFPQGCSNPGLQLANACGV